MRRSYAITLVVAGCLLVPSAGAASADPPRPAAPRASERPVPMPEVEPPKPGPVPIPSVRPRLPGPVPMPELARPTAPLLQGDLRAPGDRTSLIQVRPGQ